MVSSAASKRRLERVTPVVHGRMAFSTVKISHSLSTVFSGNVYMCFEQQRVRAGLATNGEQSWSTPRDIRGDGVL